MEQPDWPLRFCERRCFPHIATTTDHHCRGEELWTSAHEVPRTDAAHTDPGEKYSPLIDGVLLDCRARELLEMRRVPRIGGTLGGEHDEPVEPVRGKQLERTMTAQERKIVAALS
jgi:hypothetical protein